MAKALAQQMNIRIDSTLKAEGDSVFASLGMSPSEAVRAFYEVAVKHRYDLGFLSSLLSGQKTPGQPQAPSENPKLKLVEEGRKIVEQARRELGISDEAMRRVWATTTDEELLEQAMYERMVERGLV